MNDKQCKRLRRLCRSRSEKLNRNEAEARKYYRARKNIYKRDGYVQLLADLDKRQGETLLRHRSELRK